MGVCVFSDRKSLCLVCCRVYLVRAVSSTVPAAARATTVIRVIRGRASRRKYTRFPTPTLSMSVRACDAVRIKTHQLHGGSLRTPVELTALEGSG